MRRGFSIIEFIFTLVILGIIIAAIMGGPIKIDDDSKAQFKKETLKFAREAKELVKEVRAQLAESLKEDEPVKTDNEGTTWDN